MKNNIYILDDDAQFLEYLSDLLSNLGNIFIFSSPDLFLESLNQTIPDLVIIDLNLKNTNHNGFSIIKTLHKFQDAHLISIVMLTSSSNVYGEAFKLGIDDFFHKPIIADLFLKKIENILFKNNLKIHTNALTGLPGIYFIEKIFYELIKLSNGFTVAYLDLDNFKPFNDEKGVKKGDDVIKLLSVILKNLRLQYSKTDLFVGHLGGDDFFLLGNANSVKEVILNIYEQFTKEIFVFFSEIEQKNQGYWGKNRNGEKEFFPLLTISTAIIYINNNNQINFSELSEFATIAKKEAKSKKGNSLVELSLDTKNL